jgi:hypothetical protein
MASFAGAEAETDCCGNLYPLHVPLGSRSAMPGGSRVAATRIALVGRVMWTVAIVCAGLP